MFENKYRSLLWNWSPLALPLIFPFTIGCNSTVLTENGTCTNRCEVKMDCPATSGPTTLTGVVKIPAGTLPVANAQVYIPAGDVPPPPQSGASCDRCDSIKRTDKLVSTTTDIEGRFTLTNVPAGNNIPLIIKVGKWRRVLNISNVPECTTTALKEEDTRLPRNQMEGNIPKIALTTGVYDALECLLRKIGLDDSEFTNPDGNGRVNLYVGDGPKNADGSLIGSGTDRYSTGFNGNADPVFFPKANPWWDQVTNLQSYDILMLSCEGGGTATYKSANAHQALQSYIDGGGRVFASHYHNAWIRDAASTLPISGVAGFVPDGKGYSNETSLPEYTTINQSTPRGMALANWLQSPAVAATTTLGQLPVYVGKATVKTLDETLTESLVTFSGNSLQSYNDSEKLKTNGNPVANPASQYFSFYAPIGAPTAQQCGQMVFTDLHVSGDPNRDQSANLPRLAFPLGCTNSATGQPYSLREQEKALIFLLFDLTNCLEPTIG